MATKKEKDILELLEAHAVNATVAKNVYNKLVKFNIADKKALMDLTVNELVYNFGFGRTSLALVMQVICDLANKK